MQTRSGLARFKLVVSATSSGVRIYPSVDALPAAQRKEAKQALEGDLSGTLLIADRSGLDHMRDVLSRIEERSGSANQPMSVARQVGLGFISAGLILLALFAWAWLR
jgi:hypothetical protein